MASNLGIIEWVNDIIPLQQYITSRRSDQVIVRRAAARYNSWIEGHVSKSSKESYGNTVFFISFSALNNAAFADSKEKIAKAFASCYESVPNTVLQKNLHTAWHAYQYLGVDNRHLQNFLLDLKSGQLVPIDFGYAAELVPFRLTRQLVGILGPSGVPDILEDA
ncbi:hypothetical protein BD560DRAFT_434527 [Blakeslea trispora]|nr:hypothetical protein BD560DRAFT_434527 [Blakeslea trispora]